MYSLKSYFIFIKNTNTEFKNMKFTLCLVKEI